MPPFKAGLLKRKIGTEESKAESSKNVTNKQDSETEGSDELSLGDLGVDGDTTDSEGDQPGDTESDTERDEVLFDDDDADNDDADDDDDDVDSTLGDDNLVDTDDSSESSQSEPNDDSEEEGSEDDSDLDRGNDGEMSEDSDESGIGQTHSSSAEDNQEQQEPSSLKTKQKSKAAENIDTKEASQSTDEESEEKSGPKAKKRGKQIVNQKKVNTKSSIDVLADKIKETSVNIKPVEEKDEYESGDTSDEEDRRNTVGDVPAWWYKEYPHVGYDLDGRRIMRPAQRDAIDDFLKQCEDPDFWRTVRDPATGQDVLLSKDDLQLIARIRQGQVPNPEHDEYQPWIEWFSREVLATPIRAFPEHKRSFLPSRSELQQISRIVHALKMGWTKTRKQIAEERRKKKERVFYNLWGSTSSEEEAKLRGIHKHIPAPRRPPPTHAESYNPPPEYLLDAKEMKEWNKLAETPWKRKYTFLPTKYNSLRAVPAYERFIRERFLRCLDLYLAPRAIKMRLTISPEDLVPKLPSPRDLQPFPTSEALCLKGHTSLVRSIDFDPSGQYIVSGSDDGFVKVWETSTGRCLRSIDLGESVVRVAWTPAAGLSLVAAAVGHKLLLLNPGSDIGCHKVAERTDELLEEPPPSHDIVMDERTSAAVQWQRVAPEQWARGVRIQIHHFRPVTHVAWHGRGDYVAVTLSDAAARAVLVHQVSRRRSQLPFSRCKGLVQCALFHPHRPLLFVATQRVVRVYDLVKQELVRKLLTGAQWISALAVHPAGDNLLVASYDRKCMWFDLELSSKPYQTLRLHGGAVRSVSFHKRYPLFATAGDDQNIVVSHGMVYNDLLQNPLIVPLKQLRGPEKRADLCVTDVRFHPTQPWLLAAGADNTIRLYS